MALGIPQRRNVEPDEQREGMAIRAHRAAIKELRRGFAGEIVVPGDPGYDEARRIFNAMIDRRPGLIAQCAGVDDVVRGPLRTQARP